MSTTITPKEWATAQAQAAMQGISLIRTDPTDGDVQVIASRFDLLRVLSPSEVRDLIDLPELQS